MIVISEGGCSSATGEHTHEPADRHYADGTRYPGYDHDKLREHIAGTAAGATTNSAGYAVGVETAIIASAGAGTILVGDIIAVARASASATATSSTTGGDSTPTRARSRPSNPGTVNESRPD